MGMGGGLQKHPSSRKVGSSGEGCGTCEYLQVKVPTQEQGGKKAKSQDKQSTGQQGSKTHTIEPRKG